MTITTVFTNNRSQAVRLPADVRLPEGVKKVQVRARGVDPIISPVGHTWDEFFLHGPQVSEDFIAQRASQHYGAIRAALDKVERPIGLNDLHIAAHARSEWLTLAPTTSVSLSRCRVCWRRTG
jgi:antitoxin VapB